MRKTPLVVLFFGCLVTMFATQNCTQPGSVDGASVRTQQANALPFAYDAKLNQIAYMSCSILPAGGYDKSAYFSLRGGAYDNNALLGLTEDNGGIKISSEFLSLPAIRNRKMDDRWQIISESPANSGTIMQLAVRKTSKLQDILTTAGVATADSDYANLFEELGITGVSKSLIELGNGKRLRYLTNGTVQGSRMEGSLHFGSGEGVAQSLRNELNSDAQVFTLTYTELKSSGGAEFSARSPASVWPTATPTPNQDRFVYGRGYHLKFTKPTGTTSAYPANLLQSVTEGDLMGTSDRAGTWNCTDLRFKIVRPEDAAAQGCSRAPDPLVPGKLLKLARNSLRYEDWYIDMTNKCIVPKKNGPGCYNNYTVIQYDLSRECLPNPAKNDALVDLNKACLAWASVCYRLN
jgi:hypothetical protein